MKEYDWFNHSHTKEELSNLSNLDRELLVIKAEKIIKFLKEMPGLNTMLAQLNDLRKSCQHEYVVTTGNNFDNCEICGSDL